MVGGGDDDRVHVRAGQDLLVVAGGDEAVAVDLARALEAAVVQVGHRDQLHPGHLQGGLGVAVALPAQPDGGQAHALGVGGGLPASHGRLVLGARGGRRRGHGGRGGGQFQELPA